MPFNAILKLALALLIFLQGSTGLEIVETSESVQIWQGTGETIYCQADTSLDFCKWQKDDFECRVLTEEQTECDVFTASLEGDKCSLTFVQGANRNDIGSYTCLLVQGKEIIEGTVDVDVYVEATLEFGGDFATPGEVSVQLDSDSEPSTSFVECSAKGGYPAPNIKASVIDENGEIVRELEEMPDLTVLTEDDSGITEELTKKFLLVPSMEDCGLSVQCEVDQDGLMPKQDSRQLLVVYQPQPVYLPAPFQYKKDSQTVVGIRFLANPVPESNEVIWHHSPPVLDEGSPPPPGEFNLESGQVNEDGRFEALPLNVTGHEVYAVLLVNDPDDDLLEGIFYLEASNAYGKQTYEFSFEKYILDWDPEPEDVDPETPGDEEEGGEDPKSSSMGAGTIVAIVVVILGIILGFSITYWAKTNDKWCFRKPDTKPDYNQAPTSDPDIVKSKPAEAVQEEKDKVVDNPV